MQSKSVWGRLLGLEATVVEAVEFDGDADALVAHVRPRRPFRSRCGVCGASAPGYDRGEGRRRWRALDLGSVQAFVEADAPRVTCPDHGVTVGAVPWARHRSGHTRYFDDTIAWLAVACSKTAVTELMRIGWRTVGKIIARVNAETDASVDRLDGLTRIGIDEVSYKKGHKYLTVVVDHDSGRLVWAAVGRDSATVLKFFTELGAERAAKLTHVTSDAASWIASAVRKGAPNAVQCADAFHVVAWATEALDAVRRDAWNHARRQVGNSHRDSRGMNLSRGPAATLKRARWALWKNPDHLTDHQRERLTWIAKTDPRLYRAYLLKEALRYVFTVKGEEGKQALTRWLSWATRSRIPEFVNLARKLRTHVPAIHAALDSGLSNALIESTNTKIRLITRIAFGFHDPNALIALAMLTLGGYRPTLPGRN